LNHFGFVQGFPYKMASRRFRIVLSKATAGEYTMGASIDQAHNLLTVTLLEGLVADWNAQNPCNPVSPGDRILAVNEVSPDALAMYDELISSAGQVRLTMGRPTFLSRWPNTVPHYVVQTTRAGNCSWGCSLGVTRFQTHFLVVDALTPGIISKWNADHPEMPMSIGDVIVKINGKEGRPAQLLEILMKAEGPVQIELFRPSWLLTDEPICKELTCLKKVRPGGEEGSCAICLSDMRLAAMLAQLHCGHVFCLPCIHRWVTRHKASCPLCLSTIRPVEPVQKVEEKRDWGLAIAEEEEPEIPDERPVVVEDEIYI